MSATLRWRPIIRPNDDALPDALMFALRKRWEEWGEAPNESNPVEFSDTDTQYLTGLIHAGVDGAQKLLDAVKRHGSVEVYESR